MGLIVHIAPRSRWEAADETYTHPTLERDGFIHCSTPDQVADVANANRDAFAAAEPLVLLCIDESLVDAEIRYEGDGSERFPHLYGELDCEAVIETVPFERNEEGQYRLPSAVRQREASLDDA